MNSHSMFKRFSSRFLRRTISSSSYQENTVKIKGHTVNYLKTGNGKHHLICLPGAVGTIWSDFKPQIEGLDKNEFTIVALDPIGYGKSRPPKRKFDKNFYRTDANISSSLMKELSIEKYSILGWSDGGISGLVQAAAHPDRILKLVVWGSNAYLTKQDMEIYLGLRDTSRWSDKMKVPLEKIYGVEGLSNMMMEWWCALYEIHKEGGNICVDDLDKISSPVLIIHGDKDPLVPQEHPVFLKQRVNNAKLHRFPDGKHNVHLRYASEFNKIVTDFLLTSKDQ